MRPRSGWRFWLGQLGVNAALIVVVLLWVHGRLQPGTIVFFILLGLVNVASWTRRRGGKPSQAPPWTPALAAKNAPEAMDTAGIGPHDRAAKSIESEKVYYDESIESVVRYRRDPPTNSWVQGGSDSSGWTPLYNSITGLRLRVTDRLIDVRGMGPFRRLGKRLGFELSLTPTETKMMTVALSRVVIGGWAVPRPKVDYIALGHETDDGSWYTLALRPRDGDLDRLQEALRAAGVTEQ
jgi:hypothetical protein